MQSSKSFRMALGRPVMATALATSLLLIPSATAAAAFTFNAELGGCFNGSGPNLASTHVTWKDKNGGLKASFTVMSGSHGAWYPPNGTCASKYVVAGDTIYAFVSRPQHRQFTVPAFSIHADRATDIASGKAPASSSFQLRVFKVDILGKSGPFSTCDMTPSSNVSGFWAMDLTNCQGTSYDMHGGDELDATWLSQQSDLVFRGQIVPYALLTMGSNKVSGAAGPESAVTVHIRKPDNTLLGTAHPTADSRGGWKGNVKNGASQAVNVTAGRKVDGDWAGPVSFTIPALTITWNLPQSTVRGQCMANVVWFLSVKYGSSTTGSGGITDGQGYTTVLHTSPHQLQSTDVITLTCERKSGDRLRRITVIP